MKIICWIRWVWRNYWFPTDHPISGHTMVAQDKTNRWLKCETCGTERKFT